jgi:hypothetical protein
MLGNRKKKTEPLLEAPLPNTYWVRPGQLLAGDHPFGEDPIDAHNRIAALSAAGINTYIDLTEADERPNYRRLLPRRAEYVRFAIPDTDVPNEKALMHHILARIRAALAAGRHVYVHCRAGIGRTGTVIGCYLVEEGLGAKSALKELNRLWKQSARSLSWLVIPQTEEQTEFIRRWAKRAGGAR